MFLGSNQFSQRSTCYATSSLLILVVLRLIDIIPMVIRLNRKIKQLIAREAKIFFRSL